MIRMWKNYSWSYLKNNRVSGMSVIVAVFISALFLSLLVSLFYNFWQYDVNQIVREEGGWQGRLTGELDAGEYCCCTELCKCQQSRCQ